LSVDVTAPGVSLDLIGMRWRSSYAAGWRFLGDQWERSYGDLEWRGLAPQRVMPWYFLATNGRETHGAGVKTSAAAIAYWQVDPVGVTLWLDVRNGGGGVELGARRLEAASVVSAAGLGQSPMETARELCWRMCPAPRLASGPIYGGNNWHFTYGENLSGDRFLRDSELMAELASGARIRPFMVLDMGWEASSGGAGPASKPNDRFPDMPALIERVKRDGVRPGVWVRPTLTTEKLPESWRLRRDGGAGGSNSPFFLLDPSVSGALEHVEAEIRGLREWGFELVKPDFSTYDFTGRWGFEMGPVLAQGMGPALTHDGWHFADRGRTTAEIVRGFYVAMRRGAGDTLLIGCNTIGHLGAGLFEMQRIGDDSGGPKWSVTRNMGINALAFRLAQHNTFFAADADCVCVNQKVPWKLTRQWLDLVVRSGTPLFVSVDPGEVSAPVRSALKQAFTLAARSRASSLEPLDWMETTAPGQWRDGGETVKYHWFEDEV
jgi:alpha-galactosidase